MECVIVSIAIQCEMTMSPIAWKVIIGQPYEVILKIFSFTYCACYLGWILNKVEDNLRKLLLI